MGILRPFLLSELAPLLNFSISRLRGHGAHHRILRPRSFCLNEKLIRGKGERERSGEEWVSDGERVAAVAWRIAVHPLAAKLD